MFKKNHNDITISDVLAKIEALEARLLSENPLAAESARLIEAGDRLATLLDVAHARHPELGLESVLRLSGLVEGIHYTIQDHTYMLRLPGGRQYRLMSAPVLEGQDINGFAAVVREMFGDTEILLFPDYALAELLSAHPDIISDAAQASVVLGTPSTILAMFEWVRIEWQYADHVDELRNVARQMAEAIRAFATKHAELGRHLGSVRATYNDSVTLWADVEETAGLAAKAAGVKLVRPEKVE